MISSIYEHEKIIAFGLFLRVKLQLRLFENTYFDLS